MERQPAKGCGSDGADYNFTATITVNGPGEINYSWEKSIDDGTHPGGKLKFAAAGTKTVTWTWRMTNGHIENIDRYVWIKTLVGSNATEFKDSGPIFNFTCSNP